MTRETKLRETTTLDSLMSIIQRSKDSASEGVAIYLESAETYPLLRNQFEAEKDETALDWLNENETINTNILLGWVALDDLITILESNPLPAKRARFFAVACHLMPQVEIVPHAAALKSSKLRRRGRWAWAWIFNEFELPRDFLIVFPAGAEDIDIESVEAELLKLAGERVAVPLKEAKGVIHWLPRSETYRKVRSELEGRGWVWKKARVNGSVECVITVPKCCRQR